MAKSVLCSFREKDRSLRGGMVDDHRFDDERELYSQCRFGGGNKSAIVAGKRLE